MGKNIESFIGTNDAAKLLDVNPRTVRRYAEKGLLDYSRDNRSFLFFPRKEIEILKIATEMVRKYEEPVKEIYTLMRCGAKVDSVICRFDIPHKDSIDTVLDLYEFERDKYLERFNLKNNVRKDVILAEEVAARLRITDKHVVYNLIKEGEFEAYESSFNGKRRFFVSLDSFRSYLGLEADERFYTSRDASRIIRKTVNTIDRIAKSHGIGRKIKTDNKHSWYLFTLGEVHAMRYLRRKR